MARKPIKKRKPFKITAVKASKPRKPVFKLDIGSIGDPLYIDPKSVPSGVALQWISADTDIPAAWRPVPNVGLTHLNRLIWAPARVADGERDANISNAKQQMADARALFGMDGSKASPYHGSSFPMVKDAFMVSGFYKSVPPNAPSIDVDIAIKFRVSARWQDAAACLGLEIQEYARRRLIMDAAILAPYGSRFDNEMAYECVELQITRKD
jgi:hypothetical protein